MTLDGYPEGGHKFCVTVGSNLHDKFADLLLLSGKEYKIRLEVANECSASSHSLKFSTKPNCDQDISGPVIGDNMTVYPNPFYNGTTLSYTLHEDKNISIVKTGIGIDGTYLPPTEKTSASGFRQAGSYAVQFTPQELVLGLNYTTLTVVDDDEVHIRTVVKQ